MPGGVSSENDATGPTGLTEKTGATRPTSARGAVLAPVAEDVERYKDFIRGHGCDRIGLRKMLGYCFYSFGLQATAAHRLKRGLAEGGERPSPADLRTPLLARLSRGPGLFLARQAARALKGLTEILYDIRIHDEAEFGPGLFIGHFGGIYVGRCRLGRDCAIHQQSQLGAPLRDGPIIGDRVWIGPHVRIAPGVRIGDGATILSGTVVAADIPAGALVGGAPARVIRRDYDNSSLLRFYADA